METWFVPPVVIPFAIVLILVAYAALRALSWAVRNGRFALNREWLLDRRSVPHWWMSPATRAGTIWRGA